MADRLSIYEDMADDLHDEYVDEMRDDWEDDIDPFVMAPASTLTLEEKRDRLRATRAFLEDNPRGSAGPSDIFAVEHAYEVDFS